MMKTTWLLVVFTLLVVLYQATAVPVASSYKLENENFMEVMEAKEKAEEASDDDKAKDEEDEEASKEDEEKEDETKNDEDDKDDEDKKEDEEKKDDDDKKEDEESKDDNDDKKDEEEKKEDKEEEDDKEEEPDLNDQQNDQDSSGEENVDLDSEHLVLQGSGNGKIKGVVIEDSDKEKDKPEKRSVDDDKKAVKSTQARRSGFCGCCNCCGGFGCPHVCHHCCGGCCGCCGHGCESITFPVEFGACVDNPCCQCCKKKPKKGYCQWPCMWPCCCECKVPQFKLKPLKPKAVPKDCHTCCHGCCHGCCGCCHCCRKSGVHCSKRCLIPPTITDIQPLPYFFSPVVPLYYGAPFPPQYLYYYY